MRHGRCPLQFCSRSKFSTAQNKFKFDEELVKPYFGQLAPELIVPIQIAIESCREQLKVKRKNSIPPMY
jgi:hypothetical protein